MKLATLKDMIDQAVEYAEGLDVDVEVYFGDDRYDIETVSQFGIVPDVVITLLKPGDTEPELKKSNKKPKKGKS